MPTVNSVAVGKAWFAPSRIVLLPANTVVAQVFALVPSTQVEPSSTWSPPVVGFNATDPSSCPTPVALPRTRSLPAKVGAVSRLYRAVASQSSGDEAAEMNGRADQRDRAASDLRMRAEDAERAASSPGSAGVAQVIRETEAALEDERRLRPFEDFAIWLGRESDRCATPVAVSG